MFISDNFICHTMSLFITLPMTHLQRKLVVVIMLLDKGDAFMILSTKIALPTVDVVTDVFSINKVLSLPERRLRNGNSTNNLYAVAYAMAFFVVLSWIMTIPHYLRVEKTWRQRLKALPFLMVSSWPQYRGFRLLWLAYIAKNEVKFREEKKEFELNLSHIGKMSHIKSRF